MDCLCGEQREGAWEEERRDKASSLYLRAEHNMDLRFVLNSDNRGKRRRRPLEVLTTARCQRRRRSSAAALFSASFGHLFSSTFLETSAPSQSWLQHRLQQGPGASLAEIATRCHSSKPPPPFNLPPRGGRITPSAQELGVCCRCCRATQGHFLHRAAQTGFCVQRVLQCCPPPSLPRAGVAKPALVWNSM